MENIEITCHNCGEMVSADTPKCVFCGTVIVIVTNINLSEQEVNRVIVPEVLSIDAVEERVSIKHKIRLKKEPLIADKKEVVSPPKIEAIKPTKVEQSPVFPVEKEINAIFPEVEKEIAPIETDITVISPPAKEENIVIPIPKVEIPINNPFDISDLIKEANEKDKQVEAFLNENKEEKTVIEEKKPVFEAPIVEKEVYSVSDALKEIMADEQKIMDFLEEKPAAKEPNFTEKHKSIPLSELVISPEKKEEKPIPPIEKTEIIQPPKIEVPDFAPVGIEKMLHNVPEKQGKTAIAWLIRHTENRKPVYYELFEGDNTIGRGDKITPIEIDIADDKYVSRGHAWIRAFRVPGNTFVFELRDDGAKRKDKSPSMNGTYLNASMRRIEANVAMYLQDGDTIQVGMTKLVFKVKPQAAVNQNQLFTDVLQSDYTITVIF